MRVVSSFNATGLDYMFTGALAASYYGTPRTTMDVDIVVKVAQEEVQTRLVLALRKARLQVEEERIDTAFRSGFRVVTLRDSESPFSVDIIFSSRRLAKSAGTILGLPTFYQAPGELILAKLRMIKATVPRERALKDEDDVRAILRFTKVDVKSLKRWAQKESTLSILENILVSMTSMKD